MGVQALWERRCLPSRGGWDKFRELRTLISPGPPGCQVLPGFPELSGRQQVGSERSSTAGSGRSLGPWQVHRGHQGLPRWAGQGRQGRGGLGKDSRKVPTAWRGRGSGCAQDGSVLEEGGPASGGLGPGLKTSCSLLQTGRAVGWRATLEDSRARACWRGLSACSTPAVGRALVRKRGPGGA